MLLANQTTYATGLTPSGVAVTDVSGDGKADIIVANQGSDNIGVLLNAGNGIFPNQTNQSTYSTGDGPRGVITADVNNDGNIDIITADFNENTMSVFLNLGNGNLQ